MPLCDGLGSELNPGVVLGVIDPVDLHLFEAQFMNQGAERNRLHLRSRLSHVLPGLGKLASTVLLFALERVKRQPAELGLRADCLAKALHPLALVHGIRDLACSTWPEV